MKLLLDSNIWLRYFIRDNEASHQDCLKLIQVCEKGIVRPYISTIILLEVYWVLTAQYKVSKRKAQEAIEYICSLRRITILEVSDFRQAFSLHQKTGVKLADCLIATQLKKDMVLCTYDKEFAKIPNIRPLTPAQVLLL